MDMAKRLIEPTIPSRAQFFQRLEGNMKHQGIAEVAAAFDFSQHIHHIQKRESGELYFWGHIVPAAWILVDELECFDALTIIFVFTHDTLEPGVGKRHTTRAVIARRLDEDVATGTYHLTHKRQSGDKKEPVAKYIKRFSQSWQELLAKLVDRLHNMRTLYHCGVKKQMRKTRETRRYYVSLCDKLETMLPEEHKHIAPRLKRELERECSKYL